MTKVNLLAVSVGNTRTRLGAFVDGDLVETATYVNGREAKLCDAMTHSFEQLRDKDDVVILMSSVNAAAEPQIEKLLKDNLGNVDIKHVERDIPIPIGRQLDPEAIVGEDRLLDAAAAYEVLKQACVIVDAGTAITVDFVDGAGTFHGGAIAPGAQLQLDSLHNRAAQLPELFIEKPIEAIGHNTIEAMRAGVFYGLRGMVHELVEKFAEETGQFPLVIATGGDANLLFRNYELVDRIVPNLTLNGIATTLRKALEAEEA
ncbi:Type III pantothenate kinase [Poriferisphaera corsica]|uniref:Type III pantothenate kinase n=1 Tax=Poriferisphaera corsica TaxID=2528020 RepID=A0A517YQC0_9BACT|nr:type III pantothenate kinase [Poriferisphaera corsica]QDU32418.1 Type III pantothenate kinase [Poriferisphaera corsica]